MKRDLKKLSNKTYDLLIVGGGIYGAAAAWEASLQGLSVVLIEQNDFGGATSANSLKIIHGGLRYLQQLDVIRMRESIRERRLLMQLVPHLAHPLTCVMPTYGHLMKGREVMTAGMLLNDIISFDRNRLDDPEKKIPMGKVISKKRCLEMIPFIDPDAYNGGALWTDGQVYNTERLTLAFITSAVEMGAEVANYVKGIGLSQTDGHIRGIIAKDQLTGDDFLISCNMLLNTCGGWVNQFLKKSDLLNQTPRIRLSTALNLVVKKKLLKGNAAGVYSNYEHTLPDGNRKKIRRVLFMTPWRDHTVIGTFHRPFKGSPDSMQIREEEIQEALEEVNTAFHEERITRDDVSFVLKGFLPMDGIDKKTGEVILTKHYSLFDHEKEDGIQGVISVSGVKYTTARDVAEKSIKLVLKKLDKKAESINYYTMRLSGGNIDRFDDFLTAAMDSYGSDFSEKTIRHLVLNYGSEYEKICNFCTADSESMRLIKGSDEVVRAEIFYAVREEMAHKLSDVVLRRTGLGTAGNPGDTVLYDCADLMGKELNWDQSRKDKEVEQVKKIYKAI
ncbi:MAG: glycerol-3-phosphate dehydrogenase/oxidase [bacterium]